MATGKPRLSHIGLPVTDVAKSVAFHKKWAGMTVQDGPNDPGGVKGVRLTQAGATFAISLLEMAGGQRHVHARRHAPRARLHQQGTGRKIASDAKKAGILLSAPIDSGPDLAYQTYISDPDGNNLEFSFGQQLGLTEG